MALKKEKIKNIINCTELITGQLCSDGKYCILGALLHYAGVEDCNLRAVSPNSDQYALLDERFGLSSHVASCMMSANDHSRTLDERRKKLIEFIDRQPK